MPEEIQEPTPTRTEVAIGLDRPSPSCKNSCMCWICCTTTLLKCYLGSWLTVQLCRVKLLSKCYGERKEEHAITLEPFYCHCKTSVVECGSTWFDLVLSISWKKWTDSIRSNIPNAKQSATVNWVPLFDIKNSIFVCVEGNSWKSTVLSA